MIDKISIYFTSIYRIARKFAGSPHFWLTMTNICHAHKSSSISFICGPWCLPYRLWLGYEVRWCGNGHVPIGDMLTQNIPFCNTTPAYTSCPNHFFAMWYIVCCICPLMFGLFSSKKGKTSGWPSLLSQTLECVAVSHFLLPSSLLQIS